MKLNVKFLLLVCLTMFVALSWGSEEQDKSQTQSSEKEAAAKEEPEKKEEKSATQTAPAAETPEDSYDDEIPRTIEVTPQSKNTKTIPTAPGMKEGSQRRHSTYTKASKKAKKQVLEAQQAEEEAEVKEEEAEREKQEKEAEEPPLR